MNEELDFIQLLKDTEEYDAFKTEALLDLVKFKWDTIGFNFHLFGFFNNFLHLSFVTVYIVHVYIKDAAYRTEEEEG